MAVAAPAQEPRFRDEIEVRRVVVEARAVDKTGNALLGLGKADFLVEVDGRPVPLEAVDWIPQSRPLEAPGDVPPVAGDISSAVPRGRLVVYVFQTDLQPLRLTGLFRMTPKARQFLAGLDPEDRVAVLAFDSHLKLHLDFTSDRERLRDLLNPPALLQEPEPLPPGRPPSLAASFDYRAARDAATPEQGLLVTARALRTIPGTKTLALFGWGLGKLWGRAGVAMTIDYAPARQALIDARTAVCAIDITDADYHDLEVGLERVAWDTGGFYAKTNLFPDLAMRRLAGALAGHYELVFRRPVLPRGTHRIEVTLAGGRGVVMARSSYVD